MKGHPRQDHSTGRCYLKNVEIGHPRQDHTARRYSLKYVKVAYPRQDCTLHDGALLNRSP